MAYQQCAQANVRTFGEYLDSLSSPIDSFLEDHILDSVFYRILDGTNELGHFAIHGDTLLTQFFLRPSARRKAQSLFSDVLKRFGVKSAFVPTCDEFFLSQALDVGGELKKQACFFVDGGPVRLPAIFSAIEYRRAVPSDVPGIKAASGDFLEAPHKSVGAGKIHVGLLGGDIVAIGIIETSRIQKNHASIGMFTKKAQRQKGIGASTVLHLKETCRRDG